MQENNKILLIGLDGATFDLIHPWVAEGKLPTFAHMMREGAYGPLRSTIPPVSPLAWSSLATGANPGQHGIYGFLSRKPSTYDWYPVGANMRRGLTLWNWAGKQGRRVGVFNMPMTYPPESIPNGYMVSGMGVSDVDVQFVLPETLQRDLLRRFKPDQLVEQPVSLYDSDTFLDYLLGSVQDFLEVTHYLLSRYPDTDLLCSVLTATDRVQHFYWRQMQDPAAPERQRTAIEQLYRLVDAALGELIERYPDHTLIVMSDHGSGPYRHLVNLNRWLGSHGWLRWHSSPTGPRALLASLWRRGYYHLGHTLLPGWIRRPLKRIAPASLLAKTRAEMFHWTLPVDWGETQAYCANYGGNIYLNLRGREPDGQVRPGREAEELLNAICDALYELKDPETGASVVERVYRGTELYHGARATDAPDLVVAWRDGYYSMAGVSGSDSPDSEDKGIFQGNITWSHSKLVHTAEHRVEGILIAYGPQAASGVTVQNANIVDLAPTLVHLLGLPVPSTMEGRVLSELLDLNGHTEPQIVEVSDKPDADWESAYSQEEESLVQERLRRLGYLS